MWISANASLKAKDSEGNTPPPLASGMGVVDIDKLWDCGLDGPSDQIINILKERGAEAQLKQWLNGMDVS